MFVVTFMSIIKILMTMVNPNIYVVTVTQKSKILWASHIFMFQLKPSNKTCPNGLLL